ncbi:MAG: hypothetical protein ACO3B3_10475 [Cyanobium sp.]
MASKTSSTSTQAPEMAPMAGRTSPSDLPDWMAQAVEQGVKPEQALAFIGLGLMGRLAEAGAERAWIWNEDDDGGSADLSALRQRLELVQLALQTGAPLSTTEVTQLLGARPGAPTVQRGGLTARRLGRNVWKLSRTADETERPGGSFSEGFRRRL